MKEAIRQCESTRADSISFKTELKVDTFMLLISVYFSFSSIYKPHIFSEVSI